MRLRMKIDQKHQNAKANASQVRHRVTLRGPQSIKDKTTSGDHTTDTYEYAQHVVRAPGTAATDAARHSGTMIVTFYGCT